MSYFITDSEPVSSTSFGCKEKTAYRGVSGLVSGYRYYSPELGRWLSRDPIEESGGINYYSYVGNSPIVGIDPLGYCKLIEEFKSAPDGSTVKGTTTPTITRSVKTSDCEKGKKGELWTYSCTITITYYVPKGDSQYDKVRNHEYVHKGNAELAYFSMLLSKMNGECLCEPCFDATWRFYNHVASIARAVAERDDAGHDCLDTNLKCSEWRGRIQGVIQLQQRLPSLVQEMEAACSVK